MIRRPPRSTLFPYTTALPISRAERKPHGVLAHRIPNQYTAKAGTAQASHARPLPATAPRCLTSSARSEEHTSELQSLRHLVCRLLLEKKKEQKTDVANKEATR